MSLIVMITPLVVPFAAGLGRRNKTGPRVDDGPMSPSTLLQRRSDSSTSAAEEAHRMTAPVKKAPARKAAAKKAPAKKAPARKTAAKKAPAKAAAVKKTVAKKAT